MDEKSVVLHLIAGRLFGPEWAAKNPYTGDDLISAVGTAMDIYLNVTGGVNYLIPEK